MIYVISKSTFGDYSVRDIQCNANWDCCPYSDYALIPESMVEGILATKGYCDITLNSAGTEVTSFTARSCPSVPEECCAEDIAATVPKVAKGSLISVGDSGNAPLLGLKLYGKTTQNGTPTPEKPVELVSVGKSGSIKTTVCGRNLWEAAPLKPSLDTTVDEDGYITITNNTSVKQYPAKNLKVPTGNYTIRVEVASKHIEFYVCKDTMDYSNQILSSKTVKLVNATKICTLAAVAPNETIKFRVTINAGNTALPYEAYKGQTLTASTPNGLPGIPVSSGGNYTDENGQRWICDEIDFARGVYVQRVGSVASYADQEIATAYLSTTGELSAGASVLYALAEPVETPLSAEEMASYATLHTNNPNTTVFNDSGADMEIRYCTPNTAVPMNFGGKAGSLLTVDEHGCVSAVPNPFAESADNPGCYYRMENDELEWSNPPMVSGVEYRTTGRHNGKPVYVRYVDFGMLPNATTKNITVQHTDQKPAKIIEISGMLLHTNGTMYSSLHGRDVVIESMENYNAGISVNLTTQSDMSDLSAILLFKYVK